MAEKKKLGEMLIEAGLIDNLQLDSALGHQRNWGGRVGSILIELGFIAERDLAGFIEKQLRYPCMEISSIDIPKNVLDSITVGIAKKYTVFPINLEGNAVTLALMDPTDLRVIDEIQFVTGKRIKPALALESEIRKAIRKYYEGENIEGKHYRTEQKRVEMQSEPVIETSTYIADQEASRTIKEPEVEPKIETSSEREKKEISDKVILEALASLLIEKGIIRREDLLEEIKKKLK